MNEQRRTDGNEAKSSRSESKEGKEGESLSSEPEESDSVNKGTPLKSKSLKKNRENETERSNRKLKEKLLEQAKAAIGKSKLKTYDNEVKASIFESETKPSSSKLKEKLLIGNSKFRACEEGKSSCNEAKSRIIESKVKPSNRKIKERVIEKAKAAISKSKLRILDNQLSSSESQARIRDDEVTSSSSEVKSKIIKSKAKPLKRKVKEKMIEKAKVTISKSKLITHDNDPQQSSSSTSKPMISDEITSLSNFKSIFKSGEFKPSTSRSMTRSREKKSEKEGLLTMAKTKSQLVEASSLIISDTSDILISRIPSFWNISEKDLGGVYEALVPITDWDRYLETELAFFNDRIQKRKIRFSNRKEFKFIREIGRGSYGRVALVLKQDTRRYYAAKFISKDVLKNNDIKKCVMNERNIMYSIRFTFTTYLEYFIQDLMNLYFILPIALGGNLDAFIKKCGKLSEDVAKFYAAQTLLALEYLHYMSLIYRDLKPCNILLDHHGYLKVTDFGFSKILTSDKTYTMCGTAEYLAPEILSGHGYNGTVDWWSFGVLVYELCSGSTPFYSTSKNELFRKISACDYSCPNYFTDSVQMLLWNIFQLDIQRRYGCRRLQGVKDIKEHEWFSNIHWLSLANRQVIPPYKPVVDLSFPTEVLSTCTSLNMASN